MEFRVSSLVLRSLFVRYKGLVSYGGVLPIYGCLRLRLCGNLLSVDGGVDGFLVSSSIYVDGIRDGDICIPYMLVSSFVGSLGGDCELRFLVDGNVCRVFHSYGDMSFAVFPYADYLVNDGSFDVGSSFSVVNFGLALDSVSFAVSSDSLRGALSSLHFKSLGGGICDVVGSDSYTMSKYTMGVDGVVGFDTFSFSIPYYVLGYLRNLVVGSSVVRFELGVEYVRLFIDNSVSVVVRLFSGVYPNYGVLYSSTKDKVYHFIKADFLNGLKLSSLTVEDSGLVILDFNGSSLTFRSSSLKDSNSEYSINCNDNGIFRIGFNVLKLMNILKRIKSDSFRLHIEGEGKSVYIDDNSGVLNILLMPLRIDK
jgi:DNA polymerase III sliding clamp (beta) subunit (PCNA family)